MGSLESKLQVQLTDVKYSCSFNLGTISQSCSVTNETKKHPAFSPRSSMSQ